PLHLPPFPTRRSSDLLKAFYRATEGRSGSRYAWTAPAGPPPKVSNYPSISPDVAARRGCVRRRGPPGSCPELCRRIKWVRWRLRSEEHTSELQSRENL